MNNNLLLLTDSYKVSHAKQYPPGTTRIYSYLESRGGKFPSTVFFGLQYYIEKYLTGQVVTQSKIEEAAEVYAAHFGNDKLFNRAGWEHILFVHNGRLPVIIKAVPEGSVVPTNNVLMTVENTCPECFWLTNYLETLLVQVWYPTTVATLSRECKKVIQKYLHMTATDESTAFKLHDFGCRGVSSMESAGIGGAAHLVNFMGSDTVPALVVARQYYDNKMAGFSIPAAEHSTITSWTKSKEVEAYRNMLNQYPEGLVAVVSDSYDIYNACENLWGKELLDQVMNRNGLLVIRPDSGNPIEVLPRIMEIIGDKFGYTVNEKGFKVLDPHIRVIQGDGVNLESINEILHTLVGYGWSAENLAFGMGGALLQSINRDTQRFAFKASYAEINGEGREVFKQPVTDSGKNSKRGRLKLIRNPSTPNLWGTVPDTDTELVDQLQVVFSNGYEMRRENLDSIRQRATL